MASTTVKKAKRRQKRSRSQYRSQPITNSLLPKRLAAWAIETALVGASALIPFQLGVWSSAGSEQLVPLHPVLAGVERQIDDVRLLPNHRATNRRVAPSTNLFWWIALAAPAALSCWQLYLLARTGQTLGKKLLKIRVVTPAGTTPGVPRAVNRLAAKWGLPLASSYGIWRWSGAFPDGGILIGLTVVALSAEVSICWLDYRRRTLHDRIAGTLVVDANIGLATYPKPNRQRRQPVTVEVQNAYGSNQIGTSLPIVANQAECLPEGFNLWQWMRQNPGTTLMTISLASTGLVLGTFVGTQVYIQNQANQRQYQEQNNEVFLSLVNQLSSTSPNPTVERQSVILALARLDDSRVLPLLVDLLSQETEPEIIDTIEQAVSSIGPRAIPHLRRLNQSLAARSEQTESNTQRLGASKRAIAKILTLYSGQLQDVSLHRVDLTPQRNPETRFALSLEQINLSGINFRGANLNHAVLSQSLFFHPGKDQRWGTNDDDLADLSGADLSYARLDRADLSYVPLVRTNLVHANLNGANLSGAKLDWANFSSAELIGANLDQIVGDRTSFTGANLTEASLIQAELTATHLSQVKAHATDFTGANLTQSSLSGADLTEASFEDANLQQADLSSTRMIGTNLQKAQLQNADLRDANLSNADLRGANLHGANLEGVSFASYTHSSSEDFITPAPIEKSVAQIKGVNFNRAKNLSSSQIEIICQFGGLHSQCR